MMETATPVEGGCNHMHPIPGALRNVLAEARAAASTQLSAARLTPMASTDQTMASPTFTPLQPAVLTPGPDEVDLRATVGTPLSTPAVAAGASSSRSTTETREMD